MKIHIKIIALILLFTAYSCSKKDDEDKNFQACATVISESPNDTIVSEEDQNLAENLFNANQIDYANLQITKVQKDKYGNAHIRCNQFMNGLQIFTSDLIFHFDEKDEYAPVSGDLVNEIHLDNQSSLDNDISTSLYLNEVQNDSFYKFKINEIIKNCLDLQFGYYDLNAGISYKPLNIVKAWKITPHNKGYPVLYVNDATSEIIYYHNGIIIN